MAGPPLARLRVELAADSASLEAGLKDAGAALQRFAAAGVAAGNLIVAALGAVANAVASRMNDILEPTGRSTRPWRCSTSSAPWPARWVSSGSGSLPWLAR